ncbi:MAG: glycosyltransferase family 4 protein [Candidatus Abawacabacteria bacterium]|nr:glycosyltransferase family 4 protein [Candidatus Abawacabacteria bacterium]
MKIGIDVSLVPGSRAGVGTYAYNLVKYLSRFQSPHEYTLFPFFYHIYHPDFKMTAIPLEHREQFHYKFQHLPKEWIDYLWNNPHIDRKPLLGNLDLLHSTTFCVPLDFTGKLVVTIYDVSFYTHPQYHQQANIDHCLKGTLDAVEKADVIIAISEHTKVDLMRYFQCPEERIVVTPLGYDRDFYYPITSPNAIQIVLERLQIKSPYIFALGTVEPRKNMDGLIMAYDALPRALKDKYNLIIGGGKGWLDNKVFSLIQERNLQDKVKFLGYVEEDDLRYLYSGAACFVFPSHYEGFGLPLLQAMACCCPCITANNSSLLEVAGDAALLVDAANIPSITNAIQQLLTDTHLASQLKQKGLAQAQKFSWEDCAQKTLDIYNSLS